MKWVSELYGRHEDEDIYVIGTGASARVFPTGFLDGKVSIGLNMGWKVAPVTYGLTIHPDLNVDGHPGRKGDPQPHAASGLSAPANTASSSS